MKITIGGQKKMTLSNQPYEPVQVESVLMVEKELDDNYSVDKISELQEKLNKMLDKDLEQKMEQTIKKQQQMRNRMGSILRRLDDE